MHTKLQVYNLYFQTHLYYSIVPIVNHAKILFHQNVWKTFVLLICENIVSLGVICKHVVGWLRVPLVYQVTGTVATTMNITGIIACVYFSIAEYGEVVANASLSQVNHLFTNSISTMAIWGNASAERTFVKIFHDTTISVDIIQKPFCTRTTKMCATLTEISCR